MKHSFDFRASPDGNPVVRYTVEFEVDAHRRTDREIEQTEEMIDRVMGVFVEDVLDYVDGINAIRLS